MPRLQENQHQQKLHGSRVCLCGAKLLLDTPCFPPARARIIHRAGTSIGAAHIYPYILLSHLSCPPVASASGGVSAQMARSNPSTPGRQPALVEPNAAAPSSRLPARSRAQPGVMAAAFPARVDIDSFLNRLHAGGEHGGETKE